MNDSEGNTMCDVFSLSLKHLIFQMWLLTVTGGPACLAYSGRGLMADQRQSRADQKRGVLFSMAT